jgi:hypothetical protein
VKFHWTPTDGDCLNLNVDKIMPAIAQLDKIIDLEDEDLLIVWDVSDNAKRVELETKYGATRNLPSSTKHIRFGDLKKILLGNIIDDFNKHLKYNHL